MTATTPAVHEDVSREGWMSRGLRLSRRKWTLRRLLVVSIVALVALVSFGISAASIVGLNSYLERRVDAQLISAAGRSSAGVGGPDFGFVASAEKYLSTPGLPVGTVAAIVEDDSIVKAGMIAREAGASSQVLTADQKEALLSVGIGDGAQTISLGSDLGTYRAVAFSGEFGDRVVLAISLSDVQATISQFRSVLILISVLGVLAAALASAFIVSLALRPLRRVAATATQVASLPLDRGEVSLMVRVPEEDTDPRTEVGQVGAAFNGMLGHVDAALRARQASENKVRQFVADASHELRTPLASIRGYAELTRRGGHDLPADVTHSMSRVESEAVRMTSLVEDLLLLARLDEGRELEKRPVDVTRLLVNCISDAYAAGPEHNWDLDAPEQSVSILGDEQRMHQVFANLLTNARVHTPEGTNVTVTLAVEGATAVITVADNGPGIAPAVQPVLFERFARADSSRSRIAGSTGLGLSIVRAVVEAHGGVVSVTSEPGATAFRLEFPAMLTP
ncbi:two-component system OmpR family sensor kinase [Glaciihabitans tibetensis]|uniref:histidine kinase n=1 Tax=Glaciihabitans tibetensis TaxID=1266600 RepID=A0A2T0V731_9MICO|nr:ATP-binding protein [Glaciihabitans tibetensis]PRY65980.1 two-component system OmpR family sensor kinase [Glaciihabitans tibetensis]